MRSATPSSTRIRALTPTCVEKRDNIVRIIKMEEESFGRTIDGGLKIFGEMLEEHKAKGETVFSGADAFKLYDTYGFPIDLTIEMCEDEGMTVDQEGFAAEMEAQKVRAREARKALGDLGWERIDLGDVDKEPTVFTGYDKLTDTGKILAIVEGDEPSGTIVEGQKGIIVLDKTPFYAEMGGQVGDHGTITAGDAVFTVTDTQKTKAGKYLHYGEVTKGEFNRDQEVTASVDTTRRKAIHACPLRHPPAAREPSRTSWAITSSRLAPWWNRIVCASTSPTSPPLPAKS